MIKIKISLILIAVWMLGFNSLTTAQPKPFENEKADSLLLALKILSLDTNRVICQNMLADMYLLKDISISYSFSDSALSLSEKLNYKRGTLNALTTFAFIYAITGDLYKSTEVVYEGLELSKKYAPDMIINFYTIKAMIHEKQAEYKLAIEWLLKALNDPNFNRSQYLNGKWATYFMLGSMYQKTGILDSALYFSNLAYEITINEKYPWFTSRPLEVLARIDQEKGDFDSAIEKLHRSIPILYEYQQDFAAFELIFTLAEVFESAGQADSAIYYGEQVLEGAKRFRNLQLIQDAASLLADNYALQSKAIAFDYLKISNSYKDSIALGSKVKLMEELEYKERKRIEDIKNAKLSARNQIRQNALLGSSFTLLIVAFLLWRNNRNKKQSNKLLQTQKEELQSTLDKLKATQSQLIQSEKMASLGELTAGIAHEIQNPLNFVNNFSEVNKELLAELKAEIDKGDIEEVKAIAEDLEQNEEKIKHHGQRAEGIVKGMLQHSRTSQGEEELTDINALADEYLRLAYHGLQAKDKSFNADFKTDFDPSLPKINVVPQDIGRVLLNLINNAFYAVGRKAKEGADGYRPEVFVRTKKHSDSIEISVTDNGTGIPEQVRDKIFQPFFTTKPTGSGTGLGLSLSYDIVKAHGGELSLKSSLGKGSEFKIQMKRS